LKKRCVGTQIKACGDGKNQMGKGLKNRNAQKPFQTNLAQTAQHREFGPCPPRKKKPSKQRGVPTRPKGKRASPCVKKKVPPASLKTGSF